MKTFKQYLSILTVLCMLFSVCMIASCGDNANDDGTTTPENQETTTPTDQSTEPNDGKVVYTVTVVDNNGNPIEGAKVQLCFGGTCTPLRGATDENGVIQSMRMIPQDYEVSVTKAAGHITVETDEDGNPLQDANGAPRYLKFHFEPNSTSLTITLIAEEGSLANPLFISENTGTVTVEDEKIYYIAFRNGAGKKFAVNDANAILHYNDKTYTPDSNGKILIELVATAGDTKKPIVIGFQAKNETSSTFAYSIESDPGTADNPYKLTDLNTFTATASSANIQHYEWTATADGTLTLSSTAANATISLGVNGSMVDGGAQRTISVLKGETVTMAIGSTSQENAQISVSLSFAPIASNTPFTYKVVVFNGLENASGVTVTIKDTTNNTTVTTLTTDANGSASYTGVWNTHYVAVITLPQGATADDNKTESAFALTNREQGFATGIATFFFSK